MGRPSPEEDPVDPIPEPPEDDVLEDAIDDMDPDEEAAEEHPEDLDVGLPPAGNDPMGGAAPSG
jgi:hypothetical protein